MAPGDSNSYRRGRIADVFSSVICFDPNVYFQTLVRVKTKFYYVKNPSETTFLPKYVSPMQQTARWCLQTSAMGADAFYALRDVFAFFACSENQFLNILKTKYSSDTQRVKNISLLESELDNLGYHKSIVQDHIEKLQVVIECIQNRLLPP